jgi:hypothetical protein
MVDSAAATRYTKGTASTPFVPTHSRVSMNPVTIGIGLAVLLYGLVTGYFRFANPSVFKKLPPMKKFWGERAGTIVHVVAYTLLPLVAGCIYVVNGFLGMAFFDF